jgi:DNA-binding MurR/RpiR family transcriptional regulator
MGIIELIRMKMEQMTRSEQRVALYILGHMNDIAFFTLDEMARQTDVSTTTVLRFCRRLDFDGFKQFQHAVRTDLKYSPDLLDKFHRTADNQLENTLLAQTVQQGIRCIQQTFLELPFELIEEAVGTLANARRVYTFGMRESQALAAYAYSRLLTVRGDVFLYQDGYTGNVEALLSSTDADVFVVFLFHRYTRQTLRILEVLKERNVQVILITSPPVEMVARLATVLLPCQVDANGIKNSALAPICLADYLCNAVAMVNAEATLQRMRQSEELFVRSEIIEN